MADTPVLWVECEHGEGDDYLHYGDRNVRRVPFWEAVERMTTADLAAVAEQGDPSFIFDDGLESRLRVRNAKRLRAAIGDNG